ncbi:MAG TPA: cobalamin-binding protein, partial [Anaerolineales bacterium]
MLKKTILLLLSIGLLLAACAPAPQSEGPLHFTDGLGRELSLKGPAQRVVSLAPSNTEILFAVGAGAQTIGRDEFSDYPAEAKALPSVGGSMGQYSTEAILALKPDLVLAAEINAPELVKQLEDLGITVYYLKNPKTLEEMYKNLQIVASLTGHDATPLVESLQTRVKKVDEKILPLSSRVSVFYEIDGTDPAKPYTYGPGSFGDLLIERAGGYNIAHNLSDPYPQMSLEQIVKANPSFILLGDSNWGTTAKQVKARPGWASIYAVQSGQILPLDDNLISRPGPRLVDGLEQLAE